MRFMKFFVFSLTVLALGAFSLSAEVWQTKPYTEWSVKDAAKLLERSPWITTFEWSNMQTMQNVGSEEATTDQEMKSEREYVLKISVRLFSARPVRQAFVVLRANGDKARLEKLKDFATRNIDDEIIVSWFVDSTPKGHSVLRDVDSFLRNNSVALLKQSVFLTTDAGKRVYIKDYVPPTNDGTGAKFIFPRTNEDGTPFITESTKTIRFQSGPIPMKDSAVPVDATFKIKDLTFGGKVEY